MRIVLTGGSGALGSALAQGLGVHDADILSRRATHPIDLAREDPTRRISGADAIVHAARGMDCHSTAVVDNAVLHAAAACGVPQVVLISSLSVLPYSRLTEWQSVTVEMPADDQPHLRSAYAQMKISQERRFQGLAVDQSCCTVSIVRVGAVVGSRNLWTPRLGLRRGPLAVLVGGDALVPLVHRQSVAEKVLFTCQHRGSAVTYAIDPHPPTQREYGAFLRDVGSAIYPHVAIPRSWANHLMPCAEAAARFLPLRWPTPEQGLSTIHRLRAAAR